jgi:hypothetical protein
MLRAVDSRPVANSSPDELDIDLFSQRVCNTIVLPADERCERFTNPAAGDLDRQNRSRWHKGRCSAAQVVVQYRSNFEERVRRNSSSGHASRGSPEIDLDPIVCNMYYQFPISQSKKENLLTPFGIQYLPSCGAVVGPVIHPGRCARGGNVFVAADFLNNEEVV